MGCAKLLAVCIEVMVFVKNPMHHTQKLRFVTVVILLLSVAAVASAQSENDLLNRINSLRASVGLPPYTLNGALSQAALNHAQWMAVTGQVSHTQADGSTPRTRAAAAGYGSQWVSENIYAGNAGVDTAWTFWVNSGMHYRSLTNPAYQHVGIATASGSIGTAYVLVFGGTAPSNLTANGSPASASNASSGESAAPVPPPPSYVVGVDAVGNLMHEIQSGDTIGDIALLYGYTWDDVPYMLEINEMDEFSVRELEIGGVLLVPPADGTYTPTPAEPTATRTPQPTRTATPTVTQSQPTLTTTPTTDAVTTLQPLSTATETPLAIAAVPDENQALPVGGQAEQARITVLPDRSPWLLLAIAVQMILIVGAGVELVLRYLRR